jgi:hypothetical protein
VRGVDPKWIDALFVFGNKILNMTELLVESGKWYCKNIVYSRIFGYMWKIL